MCTIECSVNIYVILYIITVKQLSRLLSNIHMRTYVYSISFVNKEWDTLYCKWHVCLISILILISVLIGSLSNQSTNDIILELMRMRLKSILSLFKWLVS